MPSVNYEKIYKRALVRIDDLDLASLTRDDFYDFLKEWLHSTSSEPVFRKMFSSFNLDDEIMTVSFSLNNPVEDNYDIEFVTNILAKGVIVNYFPSKIDASIELNTLVYGKEEKIKSNYKTKLERLNQLKKEYSLELTQHGYYFTTYGGV